MEYQLWIWIKAFPMACFGISPIILSNHHHPLVVQKMDPFRLLLETDAPYLPFPRDKPALPTLIVDVALEVARIKNVPVAMVFRLACLVSRCFYKLQPCHYHECYKLIVFNTIEVL